MPDRCRPGAVWGRSWAMTGWRQPTARSTCNRLEEGRDGDRCQVPFPTVSMSDTHCRAWAYVVCLAIGTDTRFHQTMHGFRAWRCLTGPGRCFGGYQPFRRPLSGFGWRGRNDQETTNGRLVDGTTRRRALLGETREAAISTTSPCQRLGCSLVRQTFCQVRAAGHKHGQRQPKADPNCLGRPRLSQSPSGA